MDAASTPVHEALRSLQTQQAEIESLQSFLETRHQEIRRQRIALILRSCPAPAAQNLNIAMHVETPADLGPHQMMNQCIF